MLPIIRLPHTASIDKRQLTDEELPAVLATGNVYQISYVSVIE